jgi:hypothetical protein
MLYEVTPGESLASYLIRKALPYVDLVKTFAFVDADGRWFEKGKMGWWGSLKQTNCLDIFNK